MRKICNPISKAIKQSGDEGLKPSLFFTYDEANWDWQSLNFNRAIPNPGFVFHNKLPKSGSSTMNNLLRLLAQKNGFKFVKVEPAQIPNDRFDLEKPLVKFVQETKTVAHSKPPWHFFDVFFSRSLSFYWNIISTSILHAMGWDSRHMSTWSAIRPTGSFRSTTSGDTDGHVTRRRGKRFRDQKTTKRG